MLYCRNRSIINSDAKIILRPVKTIIVIITVYLSRGYFDVCQAYSNKLASYMKVEMLECVCKRTIKSTIHLVCFFRNLVSFDKNLVKADRA